jgi:hypothetical protein
MEATVKHYQLGVAAALIVLCVLLRVVPHPANFAPITAMALFAGAVLPRRLALLAPLLAIIISDTIIGWYDIMPITWACFALITLASSVWLKGHIAARGLPITLSASLFFFAATNFAVWLSGSMYPLTWSGLERCFTLALPFFRNTALSDLVYTAALFGVYALASQAGRRLLHSRRAVLQ